MYYAVTHDNNVLICFTLLQKISKHFTQTITIRHFKACLNTGIVVAPRIREARIYTKNVINAFNTILGDRLYKSSAIAEMDDRLATVGMSKKWGGAAVRLGPHWVPI